MVNRSKEEIQEFFGLDADTEYCLVLNVLSEDGKGYFQYSEINRISDTSWLGLIEKLKYQILAGSERVYLGENVLGRY